MGVPSVGGPQLPDLGDEITMSAMIGGGGGGSGGAARGGAGGGHGGGGAVDSEEARLRALQKTAIALRSAVPKKSIFEGKKGKMRRRASELAASEAEGTAQQAQRDFSTGGGGDVRAYPGGAAAQQEGAGDFTRLQQRIGGLAGLADGGFTDYAPPTAPTPTVPPPVNMARLSPSPMDQTSIPAAPMALDQTSVQRVRETLQLKTSNVAKYTIGGRVNGLGLRKQHSGTVISTVADAAGQTSGPGVVTIELD